MLAAKVEDMINTVVRQIAFYTFERKVHEERRNGELTADKICELWMSVQAESLGPAIELKPGYETFWTYIPHFIHSPFYVYAYAFGDCLVNSLYAVYEHSAAGFAERYLAMLAAGGTKHHTELLAPFGLDARDPKFWDGGLSVIAGLIEELESLEAALVAAFVSVPWWTVDTRNIAYVMPRSCSVIALIGKRLAINVGVFAAPADCPVLVRNAARRLFRQMCTRRVLSSLRSELDGLVEVPPASAGT